MTTTKIALENLANELLIRIFYSAESIADAHHLAATCKHFHNLFNSRQKLPILYSVAETQFGPLDDAIQLATFNDSQPAHHVRQNTPHSLALLKQLAETGFVALSWQEIYPLQKWKKNYTSRRLLTSQECYALRRAIYRLWLYTLAFHTPSHSRFDRERRSPILTRAKLLHNWSTPELAEIEDVRLIFRSVFETQICPTDGMITRKWRNRFPGQTHLPSFGANIHLNYPPPSLPTSGGRFFPRLSHSNIDDVNFSALTLSPNKTLSRKLDDPFAVCRPKLFAPCPSQSWGSDRDCYYAIEDMLKLSPAEILHLVRAHGTMSSKHDVEHFVRRVACTRRPRGSNVGGTIIPGDPFHPYLSGNLGWNGNGNVSDIWDGNSDEWFWNNGETWAGTLEWVLGERGEVLCGTGDEADGVRGMIRNGVWGVVRRAIGTKGGEGGEWGEGTEREEDDDEEEGFELFTW